MMTRPESVMHLLASLLLLKVPTGRKISSVMFCDTLIKPLGFIDCRVREKPMSHC